MDRNHCSHEAYLPFFPKNSTTLCCVGQKIDDNLGELRPFLLLEKMARTNNCRMELAFCAGHNLLEDLVCALCLERLIALTKDGKEWILPASQHLPVCTIRPCRRIVWGGGNE